MSMNEGAYAQFNQLAMDAFTARYGLVAKVREALAEALQAPDQFALLSSARGDVQFLGPVAAGANPDTDEHLACWAAVLDVRKRQLRHTSQRHAKRLADLLHRAATGVAQSICVPSSGAPGEIIRVQARPLPMAAQLGTAGVAAQVLVTLERRALDACPKPEDLAPLFDLTPTEAWTLAQLCTGASVDEIARASGRTPPTVRTHLSNLLRKTGTRRQSELMRVAMLLVP